jgi:hypothetical protein
MLLPPTLILFSIFRNYIMNNRDLMFPISDIKMLRYTSLLVILLCSACEKDKFGLMEHVRIADPAVTESSGIVISRQFDDVFWTHNDDGQPTIFAIGLDGRKIRSYDLPIQNGDWEDIALDGDGNLYLLDNTSREDESHRTLIHVLTEPDPFNSRAVTSVETFEVRYGDFGLDTEALFVWEDDLFLVTKPWDGTMPRVYVAENKRNSVALLLGTLSNRAMITGGDISKDGRMVALSSYRALFIFEGENPRESLLREPLICPLNAGQIEGISWRGKDLILTNERGVVFWVEESEWRIQDAPRRAFPTVEVPLYDPGALENNTPSRWRRGTWLKTDEGVQMGRISWSEKGIHLGVEMPQGLEVSPLEGGSGEDFDDWFLPGRVYVLINPRGDRQLAFGSNDRCVVVGTLSEGVLSCESRTLLPATFIQNSKMSPSWVRIEREGRWILVTLNPEGPGLDGLQAGQKLGFNLVIISDTSKILSWAPLTLEFSWDAPSFWGLIELVQ